MLVVRTDVGGGGVDVIDVTFVVGGGGGSESGTVTETETEIGPPVTEGVLTIDVRLTLVDVIGVVVVGRIGGITSGKGVVFGPVDPVLVVPLVTLWLEVVLEAVPSTMLLTKELIDAATPVVAVAVGIITPGPSRIPVPVVLDVVEGGDDSSGAITDAPLLIEDDDVVEVAVPVTFADPVSVPDPVLDTEA